MCCLYGETTARINAGVRVRTKDTIQTWLMIRITERLLSESS